MDHAITSTNFSFANQTNLYHGKVRDVYTINDTHLVIIATDRISAFDVVLPRPIPHKGQVLNQIATHFLEQTSDIAPNWLLSSPDPNVSLGIKCEPFKIEMVIRGCLTGHAWREYQAGKRELCGEAMPEGLKEYDTFPEPLITPSTKADEGHDEDISHKAIIETGLATREEFDELCRLTRALFQRGQEMAHERGLYLADTKYEFGKKDGKIYVIDEIHTPDSSRYFHLSSYQNYISGKSQQPPQHLSKEFVRQWLLDNSFSGKAGEAVPEMDDNFVEIVSKKYRDLYEQITGHPFAAADTSDTTARIEMRVAAALSELA